MSVIFPGRRQCEITFTLGNNILPPNRDKLHDSVISLQTLTTGFCELLVEAFEHSAYL